MAAKPAAHLCHLPRLLLLRLLYFLLRLQHRLSTLLRLPAPPRTPPHLSVPLHVALSGALAGHDAKLAALVTHALHRGARHVSLHDPWAALNADKLAAHLSAHPGLRVREIDREGDVRVIPAPPHDDPPQPSRSGPDAEVTVVHPGAGRAALVRAVRELADVPGFDLDVPAVTEWLDHCAEGMLPSEPDVVVVFPPDDRECRAHVLHGFPVWQLRLTQLQFCERTLDNVDAPAFVRMIVKAAAGPKRFGQ